MAMGMGMIQAFNNLTQDNITTNAIEDESINHEKPIKH
jgi:hypothetical protein